MTLGIQTGMNTGENGEFMLQIRYGAESGRLYRIDRVGGANGFEAVKTELPPGTKIILDWGSIEIGWLYFAAGMAPSMAVAPLGHAMPARPNADHKQGFRMLVHLGSMGGVREFASSSKTVTGAIDALHTAFEAAPEAAAGKLPIMEFKGGRLSQMKNQHGAKDLFIPEFTVTTWIARSADFGPRTVPPPGQPTAQQAANSTVAQRPARAGNGAAARIIQARTPAPPPPAQAAPAGLAAADPFRTASQPLVSEDPFGPATQPGWTGPARTPGGGAAVDDLNDSIPFAACWQ
jgi:hypothetical protein